MPETSARVSATVDGDGRFVDGDRAALVRLGLDPSSGRVRVPAHGRIAWEVLDDGGFCRVAPGPGDRWTVTADADRTDPPRPAGLGLASQAAFARAADFSGTVKDLSIAFAAASGMTSPIVVLIDPTGDPNFAGGASQDSRQLAAMETCRRASAPMAIWQAFEEQRLTLDPQWIPTVMTDDRFIAIRNLLPPSTDADDLVYVAIPLRNGRTVIGVVAAFWHVDAPVTADHVARWLSLADELVLGIQFSELLRRAQANGAEAERIRINDDIHAGLAQSIFALSLEIARVSAARTAPQVSDLRALQAMADELSSDVRGFLSDARAGGEATGLARRLRELTADLGAQTGAFVVTDHRVDWDEYSSDFADAVVRVVSEAFRNIAKHSAATHISFASRVDAEAQAIVVEIVDDGRDQPRPQTPSAGAGLALIRELTAQWNGMAEFDTTDHGATLRIRMTPEYQSEWAVAQRILRATGNAENAENAENAGNAQDAG